jgi:hypothetical protein
LEETIVSRTQSIVRGTAVVAVALLSACAAHSGGGFVPTATAPASIGASSLAPARAVEPFAAPKACKGQKTTAKFASLTQVLKSAGGSLCIPAIGGFGGSIFYPGATPSIKMALTTSTTNYTGKLPALGSGKVILYIQLATSGPVAFAASVKVGGGLTSKTLIAGKPYTAYGQASADGITEGLKPCYAVATKGPSGGVIGGIGSLLKGQDVPVPASGVIEIYSGKKTSTKC